MLQFRPFSIDDEPLVSRFLAINNYRNCDFSFATIFCWQHQYHTSFAMADDFFFIRYICDDGLPCYMMPLGEGDLSLALNVILNDARENNYRFRIHAITLEMFQDIEKAVPNTFRFVENRDYYEYIYLSSDLINLSGKRFQDKRNHINRFRREYPNFEYKTITPELYPACLDLYYRWATDHRQRNPGEDLDGEEQSVLVAFEYFERLKFRGGSLWVDDQIVAFSYGAPVCDDTFVVHAEKAMHNIPGVFQMMNQQFVAHEATEFVYINREEDLGLESLRKAKLSYNPVRFLERGSVFLIEK